MFEMWNMRRQETLWGESAQQLVWTHQEFDPNWTSGEDDVKCIDQMRLGQQAWKLDYCKREKDYFRATERARRISGAYPATVNRTKAKGRKQVQTAVSLKYSPKRVWISYSCLSPYTLSASGFWSYFLVHCGCLSGQGGAMLSDLPNMGNSLQPRRCWHITNIAGLIPPEAHVLKASPGISSYDCSHRGEPQCRKARLYKSSSEWKRNSAHAVAAAL